LSEVSTTKAHARRELAPGRADEKTQVVIVLEFTWAVGLCDI